MDTKKTARVWVLTALIALAGMTVGEANQDRATGEFDGAPAALIGSWVETVTPTGGNPFRALETYGRDGTLVGSTQGSVTTGPFPIPASYTPLQGQWIHRSGRIYSTTAVILGSDVTDGHLVIVFKIRQTITVDRSGDAFHAVFRSELFDPDGNFLSAFEGTSRGRRIDVEPLN